MATKTNEMVPLQVEHYGKKHKDVHIVTNNLVALSRHNLEIKDIPKNLTKHLFWPFKVESMRLKVYKLILLKTGKTHSIFHVSLLKQWNATNYQEWPTNPQL